MAKIAVCQLPLDINEPDANINLANDAIREAAGNGAKLIVLPELTNSGYVFHNIAEVAQRATTLDGVILQQWCSLVKSLDIILVAGLAIKDSGKFFNCSVIIDSTGLRGWYKKVHLWNDEADFFTPGTEPPLVIDTALGRIATMVCYDVEFPEWVRLAMLGNASILALPTNWPKSGPLIEPTPLSAVIVQAAAAQNRMIIAAADRTGLERGISWVGSSVIADSDGAIRALADQNKIDQLQILLADVDVPTDRRIGPRNNVRADRKPELYGKVLEK